MIAKLGAVEGMKAPRWARRLAAVGYVLFLYAIAAHEGMLWTLVTAGVVRFLDEGDRYALVAAIVLFLLFGGAATP